MATKETKADKAKLTPEEKQAKKDAKALKKQQKLENKTQSTHPLDQDKMIAQIPVTDLQKATKAQKEAIANIKSTGEVRAIVKTYYQIQLMRIGTASQQRTNAELEQPDDFLLYLTNQYAQLEKTIKGGLEKYVKGNAVGRWLLSLHGIGPVISAALMSHIDITKAPTAGHIWSFAGLIPGVTWEKGQKRPWNAELKTICWKAGQSFMKHSANDKCYYGHIYRERKKMEWDRNLNGNFAKQAIEAQQYYSDTTESYNWVMGFYDPNDIYNHMQAGVPLSPENLAKIRLPKPTGTPMLPPGQLDARGRRYAVKIFLSHLQAVMYYDHYKTDPPKPFVLAHLNHAHVIEPQGFVFDRVQGKLIIKAPQAADVGGDDVDNPDDISDFLEGAN